MFGELLEGVTIVLSARGGEECFRRGHHVRSEREQGIVHFGLLIEIDHDRDFARLRGAAYFHDELRESVVHQHRIGIGHQFGRIIRQRVAEFDAASRRDSFLAGCIKQDQRY